LSGAEDDYVRALHERFKGLDLSGMRILLDTANGATYRVAPRIMRLLGAEVDVIFDQPDGLNINEGCGSTHMDTLIGSVRDDSYDAGFAFDGDGDRVLAIDGEGRVVDGDELIALAAIHLREDGRLPGHGVVDFSAYWNVSEHARLQVGVYNVGDKKYWDYATSRSLPAGTSATALADIERQALPGRNVAASLTLLGEAAGPRVITRTGARIGDWIYVTGARGGSIQPPVGGMRCRRGETPSPNRYTPRRWSRGAPVCARRGRGTRTSTMAYGGSSSARPVRCRSANARRASRPGAVGRPAGRGARLRPGCPRATAGSSRPTRSAAALRG